MASTTSSCFFFAAIVASMCYNAQALLNLNIGLDLCLKADFPVLCRSTVKGQGDPSVAMESTIRLMMLETNHAMSEARRRMSSAMEVCLEVYDDAFSNLETCISNLKSHDKSSLNINLSAALTDYVTCDDAVAERGFSSPVKRTNKMLREMTTNSLYLSSLIHFH